MAERDVQRSETKEPRLTAQSGSEIAEQGRGFLTAISRVFSSRALIERPATRWMRGSRLSGVWQPVKSSVFQHYIDTLQLWWATQSD